MVYEVRILPSAKRELDHILSYLVDVSPKAAEAFLRKWDTVLSNLESNKVQYRLSRFDTLAKLGYRTVLVIDYIVLYYVENDIKTIAHIFHQTQDYASLV